MMDIKLIPYCEVDGIRTFSDSEIAELYDRMEMDNTANTVFYDRAVTNRAGFVVLMKEPGTYLYVIMRDEIEGVVEKLGVVWLNRVKYRRAHLHFCLFSNAWGKGSVDIGRQVVERLINMKSGEGEYLFDAFFGIIPWVNTDAIRYVKECRARIICNLPCSSWNGVTKTNEAGILFQYLRGQL
jgi:hypothetical protein